MGPLLFILFINDVAGNLKYTTILIFADDINIFSRINTFYGQFNLQKYLELFALWADLNLLKLKCCKCKSLTIFAGHNNLNFTYIISGELLDSVNFIKDLGIIYQSNFEFDIYLRAVVSRVFKMLGFINRTAKELKSHVSIC